MIRRLAIWFLRAWPILVMALLIGVHLIALSKFSQDRVLVNKLSGTVMQIVGGLIVLYSVDGNLGLFRNQGLVSAIIEWFRSCPIFVRSVTVPATGNGILSMSGSLSSTLIHAAITVEERLAELESRIKELHSEIAEQNRVINSRIEDVKTELTNLIASNQSALNKLSKQIETATVGGFKQQAFGVMLVIYGAVISVFA